MSERSPLPEALVICPLCSQAVSARDHERHLQQQHGLFSYRGVRRTWADTLEAVRADLFAEPHAETAWQTLVRLTQEQFSPREAEARLAEWLTLGLTALPQIQRERVVNTLAVRIAAEQPGLLLALAERSEAVARQLSLLALLESQQPERASVALLRRLLRDRALPEAMQLRLLARILTRLKDTNEPLAARALRWFVAGRGSRQAVKQLRQLLRRIGAHPLVVAALARRQPQAQLSCPRCGLQSQRSVMEAHLWQEHRLLLDGFQVREPWDVIEQWVTRAKDQPLWRERCRQAAVRLDPEAGPDRVERLLLLHQTAEPERRAAYLQRAAREHASVCPGCYAFVPLPSPVDPLEVQIDGWHLLAPAYEVRLREGGLQPAVQLVHPGEVPRWERLPGWSPAGAIFLISGPFVLLALLAALVWPWGPLGLVLGLLGVAGFAGLFAWLLTTPDRPLAARLLDLAWERLVPRLFAQGYEAQDARFVAGLARLSRHLERDDLPDSPISSVLGVLLTALEARKADPEHVAVVARLVAEIAAGRGADPVALVENWANLVFEGRIPLSFVQALLADWQADFWNAGQLARLRLRLLDRAFEAG
ncbi:MAG: hypothetical protein SNJ82_12090, partial [Gemmataceae bacterium]